MEDELRKDAQGKKTLRSKLSGRSQHIQFEDGGSLIKRIKTENVHVSFSDFQR